VLRTRLPLAATRIATDRSPFDLHALDAPPTFVLSQDQTLNLNVLQSLAAMRRTSIEYSGNTNRLLRSLFDCPNYEARCPPKPVGRRRAAPFGVTKSRLIPGSLLLLRIPPFPLHSGDVTASPFEAPQEYTFSVCQSRANWGKVRRNSNLLVRAVREPPVQVWMHKFPLFLAPFYYHVKCS
jgi:hypothetical protein